MDAMQGHAVINLRAGTALDLSPDRIAALVRDGFAAAGHDIEVQLVPPDKLAATLDALATAPGDLLLVGGGDGTLRTAAQRLAGGDKALGVLPLGTLNRYARDLDIPLQLEAAVAALAAGRVERVDVAEVNGRVFLCNSTLGLPSRYSAERQRLRGRGLVERLAGYGRAIRTVLRARDRLALSLDDADTDAAPRVVRALSLAVSNNLYSQEGGMMLRRPALDGGRLGIYVSRHRSGLRMAVALLRVMAGRWDGDPALDAGSAAALTIDSGRRHLRVVSDGELETLAPPLRYRIRPRDLAVLRPGRPG